MKRVFSYVSIVVVSVVAALAGCSSDEDTPLGSSFMADSLIKSQPGEVDSDSLWVAGESSHFINAFARTSTQMIVGDADNIERTGILRFDFSDIDPSKVVTRASLRLTVVDTVDADVIDALFYELADTIPTDSAVTAIALGDTIPDDTGATTRTLQVFPRKYLLAPATVQSWIDDRRHTGIAVVTTDPTSNMSIDFGTAENSDSDNRPLLELTFQGGEQQSLNASDVIVDGTFYTDSNTAPPNMVTLADGEVRRILFPIELADFDTDLFLHDASLTVYFDSLAGISGDQQMFLYVPESTDPNDPGFLKGAEVSVINAATVPFLKVPPYDATPEAEVRLVFPITEAVERFLTDPAGDHGFVLRFSIEGAIHIGHCIYAENTF